MKFQRISTAAVPTPKHRGAGNHSDIDAVTLLTMYLVLLFGIPSNLTIDVLGSLGRPSLLWGVVLMVFWTVSRLQKRIPDVQNVRQPIRFAFSALFVVALVSFAAALLRGQPADQVSPAFTALIRLLSWAGVLFVTLDGIRTMSDLGRIARRIVIVAGLLAALGIAQFLTKQTLVDFFSAIPGFSSSGSGVIERGGVTRASGTAIHPLEYATTLIGVFPLAIAAAISRGFHSRSVGARARWWIPTLLISVSALVGVSRSAIIGFALASVAMIPAIPRRYRAAAVAGGVLLVGAVVAAIPGLFSTTFALFSGAGTDSSTQSRVGGLSRAPEFIESSPLIGTGFGTFLPRYYIFDNAWVLMAVELGILGAAVFAGFVVSAVWSALRDRRRSGQPDVMIASYALAVALIVMAVMFAFFDALSFPISAGTFFLLAGLCGSMRNIGAAYATLSVRRPRREASRVDENQTRVTDPSPATNPGSASAASARD